VAEVALGPDQIVQFEGPVLSSGEGAQAVEDEVLARGEESSSRTESLVKEQAVTAEMFGMALNGGVGDAEGSRDLPVSGTADCAAENRLEEIWALQPVGDGEGL